jgi:tetratricopeptide (TPR) repeat protein
MAKVSLRIYNREIESMIEAGHLDEAIAHCQHILKTFPMHVETYLLLGKAFLEARRYGDAADIFERALMAVPDNFVSHVGMSIIRDDEGKLDDAIWHMERAFEVQPSNPAIQGELRRLYGRRDGMEPPKIRLTRDALANMYAQGELFNQAIAEIRAVLAETDNRPDLQVMLTRAYYRGGRKVEAVEMAANLLKKYTYCMDALRILVDVLPGTTRADDTQVYRERLHMLDPYSAFVTGSVFGTDKVADSEVNLERLEYRPGATPVASQPDWASSLGIQLAGDNPAESAPDWMAAGSSAEQPPAVIPEHAAQADAPAADGQSVPDWMRSAGWRESDGASQAGSADSIAEQSAEQIAQADIPDWLKAMAPPEVSDAANADSEPAPENPPSEPPATEDTPNWLSGLGTPRTNAIPAPFQPETQGDKSTFPDWLIGLNEAGENVAAGSDMAASSEVPVSDVPVSEIPASEIPVTELPTAEVLPSEMDEMTQAKEPFETVQPNQPLPSTLTPTKPLVSSPLPDADTSFQPTGEAKPLNIEDDAMAWLENLAVKQGAKEEELLSRPQDRMSEMPDSVSQAGEQPIEPAAEVETPTPDEIAPLEPGETTNKDAVMTSLLPTLEEPVLAEETNPISTPGDVNPQPLNVEDDMPAWLKDLNTGDASTPEKISTSPAVPVSNIPDWLETPIQKPEAPIDVPAPAKVEPGNPEATNLAAESDITITSWLSKLDVEEAVKKAKSSPETEQPAEAPPIDLPDWLRDIEKPTPSTEVSETPEASRAQVDLPDWLRQPVQPAGQESPITSTPETPPESPLPAWTEEVAPASDLPAPTAPDEWVPVNEKPVPGLESEPIVETKPGIELEPSVEEVRISDRPLIQFSRSTGTGMLSNIPEQDKDADILKTAQLELDANKCDDAMHTYSALIKKGRLLDEVIHDLREALYRFPVDIIVWQTLGDASMRANRLQDALDAYTKAEELLR